MGRYLEVDQITKDELRAGQCEEIDQTTKDDLRTATILLCSMKECLVAGCEIRGKIAELLHHTDFTAYLRSVNLSLGQLPVETAMCDYFKSGGNFSTTPWASIQTVVNLIQQV